MTQKYDTSESRTERRRKTIAVGYDRIAELLSGDIRVEADLPTDATFVKAYDDPQSGRVEFVFESDEFPVLDGGEPHRRIHPDWFESSD